MFDVLVYSVFASAEVDSAAVDDPAVESGGI